jgi:hypothetical protein
LVAFYFFLLLLSSEQPMPVQSLTFHLSFNYLWILFFSPFSHFLFNCQGGQLKEKQGSESKRIRKANDWLTVLGERSKWYDVFSTRYLANTINSKYCLKWRFHVCMYVSFVWDVIIMFCDLFHKFSNFMYSKLNNFVSTTYYNNVAFYMV